MSAAHSPPPPSLSLSVALVVNFCCAEAQPSAGGGGGGGKSMRIIIVAVMKGRRGRGRSNENNNDDVYQVIIMSYKSHIFCLLSIVQRICTYDFKFHGIVIVSLYKTIYMHAVDRIVFSIHFCI